MVVCATLNFTIEKLPTDYVKQTQAAVGAADHGRHTVAAADAGHDHLGAQPQVLPVHAPATHFPLRGCGSLVTQITILAVTAITLCC
jgi:hypothetical protein